jgi:hypothetical protein
MFMHSFGRSLRMCRRTANEGGHTRGRTPFLCVLATHFRSIRHHVKRLFRHVIGVLSLSECSSHGGNGLSEVLRNTLHGMTGSIGSDARHVLLLREITRE